MTWQDEARRVLAVSDGGKKVPVDGIIAFDPAYASNKHTGFSVWTREGDHYVIAESGHIRDFTPWDCLKIIKDHTGAEPGIRGDPRWAVVVEGSYFGVNANTAIVLSVARGRIEAVAALCSVPSMAISPRTWQRILKTGGSAPRGRKEIKARSVEVAKIHSGCDVISVDECDAINIGAWAAGIASIQGQREN